MSPERPAMGKYGKAGAGVMATFHAARVRRRPFEEWAQVERGVLRRIAQPISPKPRTRTAHVAGSGTGETGVMENGDSLNVNWTQFRCLSMSRLFIVPRELARSRPKRVALRRASYWELFPNDLMAWPQELQLVHEGQYSPAPSSSLGNLFQPDHCHSRKNRLAGHQKPPRSAGRRTRLLVQQAVRRQQISE